MDLAAIGEWVSSTRGEEERDEGEEMAYHRRVGGRLGSGWQRLVGQGGDGAS